MKRITAFAALILSFFITVEAFAATAGQVNRIFDEVKENSTVLEDLYKSGEKYKESRNVTNEYIDAQMKIFIDRVLTEIIAMNDKGLITEENFETKVAEVIKEKAMTLEPVFIVVVQEAYNDIVTDLLQMRIPEEFQPLYNALTVATKEILWGNGSGNTSSGGSETKGENETKNENENENVVVPSLDIKTLVPLRENHTAAFSDMAQHQWALRAVNALASVNIIAGVGGNRFAPSASVKREEFAKMAASAFGLIKTGAQCDFKDADKEEWYYIYISSMYEYGIIKGVSGENFGIGTDISREDIAVILYRIGTGAEIISKAEAQDKFADDSEIAPYAREAVYSLKAAGILNGSDGFVNPKDSASRAEAAQMVYNFYNFILKTQNN